MSSANTNRANLPAAILVFAFLMIWQMAALGMDAAYILPSPIQVVQKLWDLRGPLFTAHLPATMQVVAIGLIISIVLGMALAILMDASPVAEKALYPLVIASQTIPTTALAPLFVLWFGYTIWSKVLVTVLITFFPITITVFDGFRSVRTEMKDLMFCMGADTRQMFFCAEDGRPALCDRSGDRGVAGCPERSGILQPPNDDPAGRSRCFRADPAAVHRGHAAGGSCLCH